MLAAAAANWFANTGLPMLAWLGFAGATPFGQALVLGAIALIVAGLIYKLASAIFGADEVPPSVGANQGQDITDPNCPVAAKLRELNSLRAEYGVALEETETARRELGATLSMRDAAAKSLRKVEKARSNILNEFRARIRDLSSQIAAEEARERDFLARKGRKNSLSHGDETGDRDDDAFGHDDTYYPQADLNVLNAELALVEANYAELLTQVVSSVDLPKLEVELDYAQSLAKVKQRARSQRIEYTDYQTFKKLLNDRAVLMHKLEQGSSEPISELQEDLGRVTGWCNEMYKEFMSDDAPRHFQNRLVRSESFDGAHEVKAPLIQREEEPNFGFRSTSSSSSSTVASKHVVGVETKSHQVPEGAPLEMETAKKKAAAVSSSWFPSIFSSSASSSSPISVSSSTTTTTAASTTSTTLPVTLSSKPAPVVAPETTTTSSSSSSSSTPETTTTTISNAATSESVINQLSTVNDQLDQLAPPTLAADALPSTSSSAGSVYDQTLTSWQTTTVTTTATTATESTVEQASTSNKLG